MNSLVLISSKCLIVQWISIRTENFLKGPWYSKNVHETKYYEILNDWYTTTLEKKFLTHSLVFVTGLYDYLWLDYTYEGSDETMSFKDNEGTQVSSLSDTSQELISWTSRKFFYVCKSPGLLHTFENTLPHTKRLLSHEPPQSI